MRVFQRSRIFPVPVNQREAIPLPVRHDREMLHRAAVRKQLPLA